MKYKRHYVNDLFVSESEYNEARKLGKEKVREVVFKDGKMVSDTTNSPLLNNINDYSFWIDGTDYSGVLINDDDMVNSPSHYTTLKDELNGLETIDILEIVSSYYPQRISGHVWNALKYLFRAPFKGKLRQDIEKSVWYLNRALKRLGDDNEV